jgi:hypothetical protein
MGCHFISALNISALKKTKQQLHGHDTEDDEELDKYDEDLDVEVSMDIEATEDDVEVILATTITDLSLAMSSAS